MARQEEETLGQYFKRIMELAVSFGKAKKRGGGFIPAKDEQDFDGVYFVETSKETELFRAHAPVENVERLGAVLLQGAVEFSELKRLGLRNAVYVLNTLGLSSFVGSRINLLKTYEDNKSLVDEVALRVTKQDSVVETRRIMANDPSVRGKQLGAELSEILDLNWSPVTCARYGYALKRWALWLEQRDQNLN